VASPARERCATTEMFEPPVTGSVPLNAAGETASSDLSDITLCSPRLLCRGARLGAHERTHADGVSLRRAHQAVGRVHLSDHRDPAPDRAGS
jgi:hypothetical protein